MSIAKRSFTIMVASRELVGATHCPYDFTGHENIVVKGEKSD